MAAARNGGEGRSGATRSHAQRPSREHGEDGEHRTFPEVSTVARSMLIGGELFGFWSRGSSIEAGQRMQQQYEPRGACHSAPYPAPHTCIRLGPGGP
jgi:hypothetical protein